MLGSLSGRTGQCFGRFDLLHYGHIKMLEFCSLHCDVLLVGVAADEYCLRRGIPCAREVGDRELVIKAIRYVEFTFRYDEHDPLKLWLARPTDVIFLNPEHRDDPVYRACLPTLESKAQVIWIPRTPGISGTEIRGRILGRDAGNRDLSHDLAQGVYPPVPEQIVQI